MIRVKPVDKNLVTLINFNFRDVRVTLKTVYIRKPLDLTMHVARGR